MIDGPSYRLIKEVKAIINNPIDGVDFLENEDDYHCFFATLTGPAGSCYEGGKFIVEIKVGREYPIFPPTVDFLTKIYHPNIDSMGNLKMGILQDRWTPILQLRAILVQTMSLLTNPDLDNPANPEAAEHWQVHIESAHETAREYTLEFAQ